MEGAGRGEEARKGEHWKGKEGKREAKFPSRRSTKEIGKNKSPVYLKILSPK